MKLWSTYVNWKGPYMLCRAEMLISCGYGHVILSVINTCRW